MFSKPLSSRQRGSSVVNLREASSQTLRVNYMLNSCLREKDAEN